MLGASTSPILTGAPMRLGVRVLLAIGEMFGVLYRLRTERSVRRRVKNREEKASCGSSGGQHADGCALPHGEQGQPPDGWLAGDESA